MPPTRCEKAEEIKSFVGVVELTFRGTRQTGIFERIKCLADTAKTRREFGTPDPPRDR
jgi:hypothetical protein